MRAARTPRSAPRNRVGTDPTGTILVLRWSCTETVHVLYLTSTGIILVLQLCRNSTVLVPHWRRTATVLFLYLYCTYIALAHSWGYTGTLHVLRGYCTGATLLLHWHCTGRVLDWETAFLLHRCCTGTHWCHTGTTRVLPWYLSVTSAVPAQHQHRTDTLQVQCQ